MSVRQCTHRAILVVFPLLLPLAGLSHAYGQDTFPNFDEYTPRTQAVRIAKDQAPSIDGDITDAVWQRARADDRFYQVTPEERIAAPERTEVSFLYDEDTLYIAIHAHDRTPDDIKASIMVRDQWLGVDDNVAIILDPSNTRRDGYWFQVNPNGVRREGLIENNSGFRSEWNTIWSAKARIAEDGWTAEIAIPFRSINYDPNADAWGLQVVRRIRQEDVLVRWSNIEDSRGNIDLTDIGRLEGISEVARGRGIEAQIFGTAQLSRNWERPRDDDLTFEPSGNLFYRFTPSLTGTLTVNTDFSDTPLDSNQVNTGRFSLFFPETRDFFLQDAAVFEFGGQIFNNPNGLPFFSRRIGIVSGTPTDIIAGGKLSGTMGETSIGALVTRTADLTDSDDTFIDEQTLSSIRLSRSILKESKIGLVFTQGDPTGETDSTVAGIDFQYQNSDLSGDGRFTADFVAIRSEEDPNEGDPDEATSGNMYAAELTYRSEKWNWTARHRDIEAGYDPALGFARRSDIRQYNGNFFRQFRPNTEYVRFLETGVFGNYITDRDGNAEDQVLGGFFFLDTQQGYEFFGEYINGRTVLEEGFDIADRLSVPAGSYHFDEINFDIETDEARALSAEVFVSWSDIYDGTRLLVSPVVTWRPSKHFSLSGRYRWQEFSLPAGNLQIHSPTLENDINFSPDMSLSTEVQYNNISENMTWLSQFRWEPKPEKEVFVSFGHSAEITEDNFPREFVSAGSSLSLRIGQTVRF